MTSRVALNTQAFVEIEYLIAAANAAPKLVKGYAFEIPGWPEFHCCVRYGNRGGCESLFDAWIIDHYETGYALRSAGELERKEDAPEAMRKLLEERGREQVAVALQRAGMAP